MGLLGWTALAVLAIALVLGLALRQAIAHNGAGVLNTTDWLFRGDWQIRLVAKVRYGADKQQKLEMFVPAKAATPGPFPVVVFIHGGGWDSGDPYDYRFVARALAPEGYAVVVAGYRLYPHAKFPGMLEDGAAALRWVQDHARQYGADPDRVVLMGHSAGAYNAAMLALDRQWLGREGLDANRLRGVIGLAGPYDFLPLDTDETRHSFGGAGDLAATQPINFARADAPPLYLLTGDDDHTVRPRNSQALAKAMTAAGRPTTAELLHGVSHTKIVMLLAMPFARDRTVLDRVLAFLGQVTRPGVSAPVQPQPR